MDAPQADRLRKLLTLQSSELNAAALESAFSHFISLPGEEGPLACTYRPEDVDVMVTGDQMSVLSRARGRFQLVSRQHPNLQRAQGNGTGKSRVMKKIPSNAKMNETIFYLIRQR